MIFYFRIIMMKIYFILIKNVPQVRTCPLNFSRASINRTHKLNLLLNNGTSHDGDNFLSNIKCSPSALSPP